MIDHIFFRPPAASPSGNSVPLDEACEHRDDPIENRPNKVVDGSSINI
jgi:hypothetical protein